MDFSPRIAAAFARLVSAINAVDVKASNAGAGVWSTVIKTADENRTANAALTVDSSLKKTLAIGQHRVRVRAEFLTANATMDFKYDLNFTGTATWKWRKHRHIIAGSVAGTDNETVTIGIGVVPSTSVAGTTTGAGSVEIDVIIVVTVAGEFQFRWGQNTSDAGALTCLEGSYLDSAVC